MFYWVNQGKTYKEEKEGGYLWAPIENAAGRSFFYWENMTKLLPNDVVFNYKKGHLVGYCIVKSKSYLAPQPEEFNVDAEWENEGYMVDAEYFVFDSPIGVKDIYNEISNLLPSKYSPLNAVEKSGVIKVKANQGYLYELSDEIGDTINKLANDGGDEYYTETEAETNESSDYKHENDPIEYDIEGTLKKGITFISKLSKKKKKQILTLLKEVKAVQETNQSGSEKSAEIKKILWTKQSVKSKLFIGGFLGTIAGLIIFGTGGIGIVGFGGAIGIWGFLAGTAGGVLISSLIQNYEKKDSE